jgi:hypothetical protein
MIFFLNGLVIKVGSWSESGSCLHKSPMAFRLWPDFNGISILTRKMSSDDLLRTFDNEVSVGPLQRPWGAKEAFPNVMTQFRIGQYE